MLNLHFLGDCAATKIAAVGHVASVEGVSRSTLSKSIDVDAVPVPISRDMDGHFLVNALTRIGENARARLRTIDEDIRDIIAMRTDNGGRVIDGDIDLQGVLKGCIAELNFGQVALADHKVFVVNRRTSSSVAVEMPPVLFNEIATLGSLRTLADMLKSQHDSLGICSRNTSRSRERNTHHLLGVRIRIANFRIIDAHYLEIAPFTKDVRSRFLFQPTEVVASYNCHLFKVLCIGTLLAT